MALNIPLFEDWRLRSDALNVIIEKTNGNRVQEQYFYSTIEGAITGFIERKIRGFDANNIFGLLQSIKSLQTALSTAIQPLKLVVVPISELKEEK